MKALIRGGFVAGVALACAAVCMGRSENFASLQEPRDSWPVRLAYWKADRGGEGELQKKREASVGNGALTLRADDGTRVTIPGQAIRVLFYDQALRKEYLKEATRPQPADLAKPEQGPYLGAEVALVTYGAVATAGAIATGGTLGAVAPALAFPPAFAIAAGGIVAVELLKDPKHFIHIIWEEEGTPRAAALEVKKKFRQPHLSSLEEAAGRGAYNLPETRKKLRAEIQQAMPHLMRLRVHQDTVFGGVVLKKKLEGHYKLILLERNETPDELYFFYPSVSLKNPQHVALAETVEDGSEQAASGGLNESLPAAATYFSGLPRRIKEIRLQGKWVRNPVPIS